MKKTERLKAHCGNVQWIRISVAFIILASYQINAFSQDSKKDSQSSAVGNTNVSAEQINKWIMELGSKDKKIHAEAHSKLLKAENAAIPELKKFINHNNSELQSRVRIILSHLAVHGEPKTAETIIGLFRNQGLNQIAASTDKKHTTIQLNRWLNKNSKRVSAAYNNDGQIIGFYGFGNRYPVARTPFTVTDTVLSYFRFLDKLEDLDLTRAKITDAGLAHIRNLTSLKDLSLYKTNVTDKGMVYLRESYCRNLCSRR